MLTLSKFMALVNEASEHEDSFSLLTAKKDDMPEGLCVQGSPSLRFLKFIHDYAKDDNFQPIVRCFGLPRKTLCAQ